MNTQTTAIGLPEMSFAMKLGKNERQVSLETVLAIGSPLAKQFMQEQAFASAARKAMHGRYNPAIEIMGFAASAQQVKAVTPADGVWTKARVGMLAELIAGRAVPPKGWTKRAIVGRTMAKLISDIIEGRVQLDVPPVGTEDAKLA